MQWLAIGLGAAIGACLRRGWLALIRYITGYPLGRLVPMYWVDY